MLKQSTTFRPLMWELVVLATIAVRAGDHKIRRVVRSSAGKRDDVVNVVLGESLLTIIALAFLCAILSINISPSVLPLCAFFVGAAIAFNGSDNFGMGGTIAPANNENMFSVRYVENTNAHTNASPTYRSQSVQVAHVSRKVLRGAWLVFSALGAHLKVTRNKRPALSACITRSFLRICALPTIRTPLYLFASRFLQMKVVLRQRLNHLALATSFMSIWNIVNRSSADVDASLLNISTLFAYARNPISMTRRSGKELGSCGLNLRTLTTTFMPVRNNITRSQCGFFPGYFCARPTLLDQPVFSSSVGSKMLRCGGEFLLASDAAFECGHSLNGLSSSALSFCCQSSKATASSSPMISQELGNMFILPFLLSQQEAEVRKS